MKFVLLTCLALLLISNIKAQYDDGAQQIPISMSAFLSNVMKGNLELMANQFNVSIAEAELKASRVFADPELAFEYANNEDWSVRMGQSYSAGLSYPVSLGNVRSARIGVARVVLELEQLVFAAWLQNLMADASLNYYKCLRDLQIYRLHEDTHKRLQLLAGADSLRFRAGDITEIDAARTRLEAHSSKYELERLKSELTNSLLILARFQGKQPGDTLFIPSDGFPLMNKDLVLSDLISRALANRADLNAAIKSNELNEQQLLLIKAQRAPEFSIEAGYSYNSIVLNDIAPAPEHNSLAAGIVIPFKLSNVNKGELIAAKLAAGQSDKIREDVENLIVTEVTQAYNVYRAMHTQIEHYSADLIRTAERILEGRTFLYNRGETNLIDVLEAQRTYNEMKIQYYQVMYDYASSVVELRRSEAIE
jgi:cobalt-zinc-cadmium efflux system outer membrane protein